MVFSTYAKGHKELNGIWSDHSLYLHQISEPLTDQIRVIGAGQVAMILLSHLSFPTKEGFRFLLAPHIYYPETEEQKDHYEEQIETLDEPKSKTKLTRRLRNKKQRRRQNGRHKVRSFLQDGHRGEELTISGYTYEIIEPLFIPFYHKIMAAYFRRIRGRIASIHLSTRQCSIARE